MKLTKENVCVFIENEAQLEEARKMLEKYDERIDEKLFEFDGFDENYLVFSKIDKDWFNSYYIPFNYNQEPITLQQLEEILKEAK
jgi:hypothetical protein